MAATNTRLPPRDNTWPRPDRTERMRYHAEKADLAGKEQQWFTAEFHLGKLLLDDADNAELKRRREQALTRQAGVLPKQK